MPAVLSAHPFAWVRCAALPIRDLDAVKGRNEMWNDVRVRRAVGLASPSLADALSRPSAAGDPDRLLPSLRSYYARMCTRPTPFGAMAGVFTARLSGPTVPVDLDLAFTWHLRTERLDPSPDGFTDDDVIQLNVGLERSGRGLLVPPPGSVRSRPGQHRYVEATDEIESVLDVLKVPMPAEQAVEELVQRVGDDRGRWLSTLRSLARRNIVVSAGVVDRRPWIAVRTVSPDDIAPIANYAVDDRDVAVSVDAYATRADGAHLPTELGNQAIVACEALDRICPDAAYPAHLATMAVDFTARFGTGAEVRILDAFSGLGGICLRPAEARLRAHRPEAQLARREQLLAAAVEAIGPGAAIDVEALAVDGRFDGAISDHIPPDAPVQEITLRPTLSPDGLVSELIYAGAGSALGGRFNHLPAEPIRVAHDELADACERSFGEVEIAELVTTAMVAGRRVPGITPVRPGHRRLVSVAPQAPVTGSAALGVQDLVVGVDPQSGRWYVRSARSGRRLHLVQGSMARDDLLAPLEAFLLQVCRAQYRYASAFDWGALSSRTFLPSINAGPVSVHTARWLLGAGHEDPRSLTGWLDRQGVPARFVARPVGSDRGFLIRQGTDNDLLLRLLRRTRSGLVELKEAPDARGSGLVRDSAGAAHVADVVVTVFHEAPVRKPSGRSETPHALPADDARAEWTAVDLTMPWAILPHFLLDRIGGWLASPAAAPISERTWWEIRESDARLRVFIPARAAADRSAADAFWHWCRDLRRDGELTAVAQTEHPVLGDLVRSPLLIATVHEFLAVDSRTTMTVLRTAPVASIDHVRRCSLHLYRLLTNCRLPVDVVRDLAKREEHGADRRVHDRIGRDLYATARVEQLDDWVRAWHAVATAAGSRMEDLLGPIVAASLDRLCVTIAVRPHIYATVRRLIDRHVHESRSTA